MNAKERHLIALDLDDTILSTFFSLCSESVRALIEAQNAGHVVMIATARPEAMALPYHRAMGFHGPICTLNGAYLYHPDDKSFSECVELMNSEAVQALSDIADKVGVKRIWTEVNDHAYAVADPAPDFFYFHEIFRQSGVTYSDKLPIVPSGRTYLCADTQEQADEILKVMRARDDVALRYYVSASGEHRINFCASTADKWFAVKRAADYYGIPTENIITFGDAMNDYQMIFNAGHGFVMCNGNKEMIAEARQKGVGVTEYPCAEGGIAKELKKLL